MCFLVNVAKYLSTAFSIEQLWWLLLELRHFFSDLISFSVGSSQPGKYSYEISYECY